MSQDPEYAITARDVTFSYGKQRTKSVALSSVNVSITKGEIYGILGPSGCGKTTFLKLIVGLKEPCKGHISVFGYKPGSVESGTPGIGVGYMPQEISLPYYMKIHEVFKYFGNLYLLENEFITTKMKYFLKLLNFKNEQAFISNLSGGEKRFISLAIALFSCPRLLVLDEPTVGVDPLLRQEIWSLFTQMTRQSNTTIIVTTHYISEIRSAATVAFMRKGEILEEMQPSRAMEKYNCRNLDSVLIELCLKQKACGKQTIPILESLGDADGETVAKKNTSIIEPLTTQRSNNCLRYEMSAIKASIVKSYYHDWRVGAYVSSFIVSLFCTSLFATCVGTNPEGVTLGWVVDKSPMNCSSSANETESYLPNLLLETIDKKVINIVKYENLQAVVEDTKRTKIIGYIHLKQNFSTNFYRRDSVIIDDSDYISKDIIDSGTVHLYLDSTSLLIRQLIAREIFETVLKFREKAFMEIGIDANVSAYPYKVAEPIHGTIAASEVTQFTRNTVVCFVTVVSMILAISISSLSVVSDIASDFYSRSISAGLKPHHIIIGELISRSLFGLLWQMIILITIIFVFNVTLKGSSLLALVNIQLVIACGLSLGALFAVVIRSTFFCHIFVAGFAIGITIVSGTFWSLEAFPYYLKPVVPFFPSTLPIAAMLRIFNYESVDFVRHVLPGFVSSTLYCILANVITCYFLRRLTL